MRYLQIIAVLTAALFLAPPAHAAPSSIGGVCNQIGRTTMDTDGANLMACLCDGGSSCAAGKWKLMSVDVLTPRSANPFSVSCSGKQVLNGITAAGQPMCIDPPLFQDISCPLGQSIVRFTNGVGTCG